MFTLNDSVLPFKVHIESFGRMNWIGISQYCQWLLWRIMMKRQRNWMMLKLSTRKAFEQNLAYKRIWYCFQHHFLHSGTNIDNVNNELSHTTKHKTYNEIKNHTKPRHVSAVEWMSTQFHSFCEKVFCVFSSMWTPFLFKKYTKKRSQIREL